MRRLLTSLALGLLLTAPLPAQEARLDPRLTPLLGCWVLAPDAVARAGGPADASVPLCIVPGVVPTQVRLVTMADDVLMEGEVLDVTGRPTPLDRGACRGTRTGAASGDVTRFILSDELGCADRPPVRAVTVLDLVSPTRLAEVRGWRDMGAARQAQLIEREAILDSAQAPVAAQVALAGWWRGIEAARGIAGAGVRGTEIVEVSANVTPAVARAWLLAHARQSRFEVTADLLRTFRDAGVPGEVTDMLVAGGYPEVFQFTTPTEVALRVPQAPLPWDGTSFRAPAMSSLFASCYRVAGRWPCASVPGFAYDRIFDEATLLGPFDFDFLDGRGAQWVPGTTDGIALTYVAVGASSRSSAGGTMVRGLGYTEGPWTGGSPTPSWSDGGSSSSGSSSTSPSGSNGSSVGSVGGVGGGVAVPKP